MIEPRTVLVFAPHPDDEVIACGGTILKRRAEGCAVHIVFSTDGSQSHNAVLGIADDPTPEALAAIRRGEVIAAAAALGVPADHVTFVGAEDTRLVDSLDLLRAAVDHVLATSPPAEVYIPHEVRELNADHSLTGRIVLERLAATGLAPRVFKYVVWDAEVERGFGFVNREGRAETPASDEILHREDIAPYLERKFLAMLEHKTQTTLFSASQTRPVVPPVLMERVRTRAVEEFWIAA